MLHTLLPGRLYRFLLGAVLISGISIGSKANPIALPTLGGVSTKTTQEEKRIGKAWLKQYQRQIPTLSDPVITAYIEDLIKKLIPHSQLESTEFSLVIAKNRSLNAFAVPGGVIGIHTGLLNYAKTEQQLASVIAHELAHLSQRHYARSVEKQRGQTITAVAGLLAALVLAANSDGDAGSAAISATQAIALDQQLRFSRSFESEADRIGLDIMVKAGMNPHALEEMFSEMERASRFSSRPPEYLLTHPLASNRIVDAINNARKYPKKIFPESINYQFVRARALLLMAETPQQAIARFKSELSGFDSSPDSSNYGLAMALIENKQYSKAEQLLNALRKQYPDNAILHIAYSELLSQQGKTEQAVNYLKAFSSKHPEYYPYRMHLSQLYTRNRNYSQASKLLVALSKERKDDPSIWYDLAELSGLNGNILLLHKARAEYFILYGSFDNAEQQLRLLVKNESAKNSSLYQYATERIKELKTLREQAIL